MRIFLDSRFYGSKDSGLGIYAENLISNLVTLFPDDEFVVLLPERRRDDCKIEMKNLTKVFTKIPHYSFSEQVKIPGIIKKYNPDVVHFLNFNKPLLYLKSHLVTFYDLTLLNFRGRKGGLLEKTGLLKLGFWLEMALGMRSATRILSISDFAKEELIEKFKIKRDKIRTILLGYEEGRYSPDKKPDDDERIRSLGIEKEFVFYIGNDRPHKNLLRLLDAWENLDEGIRNTHQLVLGGKIDLDGEVWEMARNIGDSVKILGYANDHDKPILFRSAKAFVFPSLSEGFGLPIIEAMASGTPVISSNKTSLPEAGGDAALYFDPKSMEDIKSKIHKILSDKTLQNDLQEKGLEQIKKFSWKNVATETHEEYERIFDGKS